MNPHARIALSLAVGGVLLAGLLLGLQAAPPTAHANPGTYFVTPGGGGAGTQSDPCDLATALGLAADGDTLYLAPGTYIGAGDEVVRITHSITLYGGWDGSPSGPVNRDPALHVSILDGQHQRRVVYIAGAITPILDGLTITGGNAGNAADYAGRGGGLCSGNANPIIQHNVVVSNTASITPTGGLGGGIYLGGASASALISGNLVLSNTAAIGVSGHGGGLYLSYSDATVCGNLVQGNASPGSGYGGGMYVDRGAPRLVDNEIRGNVAGRNGGGIYMAGASALVQGNLVAGNMAGGDGLNWNGGGILISQTGSPTITGNRFLDNGAGSSGGIGVSTSDYFTVTNNLVSHNNSEGVMLWETPHYGLVAHNTIAYNGKKGGIYLRNGYVTPTIVNNVVVFNTYGINAHTDATGTLDYNAVWGNTTQDYNLPGALAPGPHDVQADPRFVDPTGNDYHLRWDSPCIDAGTNAGVDTDLDGDSRPSGAGYDIGAYEFRLWYTLFLPLAIRNY